MYLKENQLSGNHFIYTSDHFLTYKQRMISFRNIFQLFSQVDIKCLLISMDAAGFLDVKLFLSQIINFFFTLKQQNLGEYLFKTKSKTSQETDLISRSCKLLTVMSYLPEFHYKTCICSTSIIFFLITKLILNIRVFFAFTRIPIYCISSSHKNRTIPATVFRFIYFFISTVSFQKYVR